MNFNDSYYGGVIMGITEKSEKVSQILSYTQLKFKRTEQEKQVKQLRKRLAEMESELSSIQAQEQEVLPVIDLAMLVDKQSIKVINDLLSSAVLIRAGQDELPVGCAVLLSDKRGLRLSVVFAKPLFSGWRTEVPYKSWQMCPLSLETPTPPSENHIPEYDSLLEHPVDLACWELSDNELRLWRTDGASVAFVLSR